MTADQFAEAPRQLLGDAGFAIFPKTAERVERGGSRKAGRLDFR